MKPESDQPGKALNLTEKLDLIGKAGTGCGCALIIIGLIVVLVAVWLVAR